MSIYQRKIRLRHSRKRKLLYSGGLIAEILKHHPPVYYPHVIFAWPEEFCFNAKSPSKIDGMKD